MVLSDRYGGKPRPSLAKRTLIYVLSFGLGALLLVGVLGFTMVSIAEGLLPKAKETPAAATTVVTDDGPAAGPAPGVPIPRFGSKARPRRANEASGKGASPTRKSPL